MTRFGSAGKDLSEAERAAEEISREFSERGIRHAIVGGLAVVAHGYARSTADVDILVTEAERVQGRPLGIPGVSFEKSGVPVDVLFIEKHERFLRDAVTEAEGTPPIIPFPALAYLKLKAGRAKDFADLVELLKADPTKVAPAREWLHRNTPFWIASRFENVVSAAKSEGMKSE